VEAEETREQATAGYRGEELKHARGYPSVGVGDGATGHAHSRSWNMERHRTGQRKRER